MCVWLTKVSFNHSSAQNKWIYSYFSIWKLIFFSVAQEVQNGLNQSRGSPSVFKASIFSIFAKKKTNFMKYELKRNLLIVTIIIGALLPWISDNIETAKCNFWTGWMVSLQKWLIHIFSAKFVQSAFVTGFPKRYKTSRSKIRMSIV